MVENTHVASLGLLWMVCGLPRVWFVASLRFCYGPPSSAKRVAGFRTNRQQRCHKECAIILKLRAGKNKSQMQNQNYVITQEAVD